MNEISHIVSESLKGNPKAQRQLYEKYRTKWYLICLRYGRNKSEGEDIFQEGLIQIYTSLKNYDSQKSQFATWSSKVMMHTALGYLKKNSWQSIFGELKEESYTEEIRETVFHNLAAQEITQLIQRLPIGYRIVFNMFAIEGFSHKEIATALGISENTSKSQLFKARRQLKKQIESQLDSNYTEIR